MKPTGRPPSVRLPFEPISMSVPDAVLADEIGVSRRTVIRWRARGVPLEAADRVAAARGYHVAELWPSFHQELIP